MGKATTTAEDKYKGLVSGSFAALGYSAAFPINDNNNTKGAFNATIWGIVTTTMGTTTSSKDITVASATGILAGQRAVGVGIPDGAFVTGVSGTTITLSDAATATAASGVAVSFLDAAFSATVRLVRSFDGGATYHPVAINTNGDPAEYTANASIVVREPEQDVLYRLECYVYSSGTIGYRISK